MKGLIPFVVALTVCWSVLWAGRGNCYESAEGAYNRIASAAASRSNYDEEARREATAAQMATEQKQFAIVAKDNEKRQQAIRRKVSNWDREADDRATENLRWHTWIDASGEHKTEAKYSRMIAGNLKLIKRDGSEITIALEKLSDADRAWVTNWPKIKDASLHAMSPSVYLTDLKPKSSTAAAPKTDWPSLAANSFYASPDESTGGQGKPSYSLLSYDLTPGYQLLSGEASVGGTPDKTVKDKHGHKKKVSNTTASPLVFQVLGDGHLLWSSKPLHKNESNSFLIDITRVGELQLRVDCSDEIGDDRATWKDALLRRGVANIMSFSSAAPATDEKKKHKKH